MVESRTPFTNRAVSSNGSSRRDTGDLRPHLCCEPDVLIEQLRKDEAIAEAVSSASATLATKHCTAEHQNLDILLECYFLWKNVLFSNKTLSGTTFFTQ